MREHALIDGHLLERDAALNTLQASVSELATGVGGVIAVSGEAGIGKTSLLRAFVSRVGNTVEVLRGGCEDLSMPRLLGPFFDMVDQLGPDIGDALVDKQRHAQLFTLIPAMLRDRGAPTIIIIEDIHWADEATLDLIKFLGRRVRELPALLVLSHRDDEPGGAFSIGRVLGNISPSDIKRIGLGPLSSGAIAKLATDTPHDPHEILAITGGNPFFVTEILANDAGARDGLPLSVRDAVWSRIERCTPSERTILKAFSIIPGGANRALLLDICPEAQPEQLDRLIAAGMLIEDGPALRFRHELARQASLQLVPAGQRRSLHLSAGAWLSQNRGGSDLTALVQRIHHANAAEDASTIVELAPVAAKHAAAAGAHKQAAQLLALALPYADTLPTEDAALLYEGWSHEAGLAQQIDQAAIDARRKAIALWSSLGRTERVGHNLLWLSRFLWYLGQGEDAQAVAQQALEALESCEPGAALAWSHSFRSQFAMLNDRFDESIEWGEKAIALGKQLGEHEVHMHALNNVGSSFMLTGRVERGKALLQESLVLALHHHEHVHAARAYTNLSENALAVGDLETASHFLDEGIAFDTEYDLDSWLHYLRGCKARYLMMNGQLSAAAALARDVLSVPNQTLVMRLPADTVLAHVESRMSGSAGKAALELVLENALGTKEPQRIAPVRIALAESMWLAGDMGAVRMQVDAAVEQNHAVQAWHVAELHCWAYRAGRPLARLPEVMPEAMRLECTGQPEQAARAYAQMKLPFEEAMALCQFAGEGRPLAIGRAIGLFQSMGATRAAARMIELAHVERLKIPKLPRKRGNYSAARSHPAGLTAKEQKILRLLSEGASNAAIATSVSRSIRTVEHHVAAVLAKLNVANRSEVISKVNANPGLLGDERIFN